MNEFERLHPAIQYHIVNSLGWSRLRPLQEQSLGPILDGHHCLLIAPTAGGKTEAAVLPMLSRMISENWGGVSVLYLCPIKALLNNLEARLSLLSSFLGRRAALWHGDIATGEKRRAEKDLPDILLTTPESLEGILIGSRRDHRRLLGGIRCVVIDELHAFAGDDRGWHVLALLERIRELSGLEMQRIGLSATVGHPASLLEWMAEHCDGERRLVSISAPPADIDLSIDFVGSLDNAATVISQLHRGEKRLVFCDSRSRVEVLAQGLRTRGVDTFVSHAALSADTRRQAEQAFSERQNCVIVATSTLELGLDVGDLDRVIQIDAPHTVASFLQRLGRTGRREGVKRNALFLATTDVALLECAALASLFQAGYVEPVVAPAEPYHIMVQQLLASILQSSNELGERDFAATFLRVPEFARLLRGDWKDVIEHLVQEGWIVRDGGQLSLGPRSEARFRGKGLADLCVSFESSRSIAVYLGNKHLGDVDPLSLVSPNGEPKVISLAGRAWRVAQIVWSQQRVYVEPSDERGCTRWLGNSRGVSSTVAQQVRHVIGDPATVKHYLTRRADERLNSLSTDLQWTLGRNPVKGSDGNWVWWTFAGFRENQLLAAKIESIGGSHRALDGYSLRFELNERVLSANNVWAGVPQIRVEHIKLPPIHFKFDELLSESIRHKVIEARSGVHHRDSQLIT